MSSEAINLSVLEPRLTKYIPILPHPRQVVFLLLDDVLEVMFGGQAGGGKSASLLAAALQYVDVPNYSALLLRRTYTDLSEPKALMDVAHQWLQNTGAHWTEAKKTWRFPSGATLTFGYLETENDKYRYQGAEFQYIGFDELTQFTETQYRYLFSRLRRTTDTPVPLRLRGASNPGGVGHEWVRRRFVNPKTREPGVLFIRSTLDDNPSIPKEEYERSLSHLDNLTRKQLMQGIWTARSENSLFLRENFRIVKGYQREECVHVRYWDTAATKGSGDFTCGVKMARHKRTGEIYVPDVKHFRETPMGVERRMLRTAQEDGYPVTVYVQQEPGSAGKIWINNLVRHTLAGFDVRPDVIGNLNKAVRSRPWSAAVEAGVVSLVEADWNEQFIEEHEQFTEDPEEYEYDDQVDSASGAHSKVTKKARLIEVYQPRAHVPLGAIYAR